MSVSQQGSKEPSRQHSYHLPNEFAGGAAPGISVHQATPDKNHHPTTMASSTLPGPLQSGRPGPPSINTTSSIVTSLPQTPAQLQRQSDFARTSSGTQVHSYSKSSPTGPDQKYVPYINTPENSKYASTPTQKYTSQTPKADASYSPLGLADIRPHTDSGMSDTPSSANPYSNDGASCMPTNSNYLAPWAVYAFDWCKWPVQKQNSNDGAGKMAIGSYVEDGHNFVGLASPLKPVLVI
jgi:WD repeat-containing protein 68